MILLIDNYDSFVYNLARYITELNQCCKVIRNDKITLDDIEYNIKPTHIILSPGPCAPNDAGICLALIRRFYSKIPILGVCLGHQAIGQAFGATISHAKQPMHGMSSHIQHNQQGILHHLKQPLPVARYHSLIVSTQDFPDNELQITAWSEQQEIMALQHKKHPVYGVQFHPESVLTECGHQLLSNFISHSNLLSSSTTAHATADE